MNQENSIFKFQPKYTDRGLVFVNKLTQEVIGGTDIINWIFNLEQSNAPYTDKEYQQDWMDFISLCLSSAIAYKFHSSKDMSVDGFIQNASNAYMDSKEVMEYYCRNRVGREVCIW